MSASPGLRNPFRPGVGTKPPFLAGREKPLRRFGSILGAAPQLAANVRITGLRGVGKTVLLQEFAEIARAAQWHAQVHEFSTNENTDEAIVAVVRQMTEQAKREISTAHRVRAAVGTAFKAIGNVGVSWGDVGMNYSAGADERSIVTMLNDACQLALAKDQCGLLLMFDEAQVLRDEVDRHGQHPLSILIAAVVALQKVEVPIGLVLCGLPTLTGNLLKAKSYTERMFRSEEIGSLDTDQARLALTKPLENGPIAAEAEVVERIISEVRGYPYFVQLWGAELWDVTRHAAQGTITSAILDATQGDIYQRLDQEFYAPRLSTLTPAEQDLLLSTAQTSSYPPLRVSEVGAHSEKSPGNINVLLGRLVESGVLYRLRKGEYDYTAPKFRDYLHRHRAKELRSES